MSIFFPQAEYAEDQILSKTILVSHVMHRGMQTGVTIGMGVGAFRAAFPRTKPSAQSSVSRSATHVPASSSSSSVLFRQSQPQLSNTRYMSSTSPLTHTAKQLVTRAAFSTIERSAGMGAVVGAVAMGLMMPGYMYGKETIEWQDRSWRLLANQGQVEVDSWSLAGAAAGIVSLRTHSPGLVSWKTVAGRAGMGSMVGVVGYMGWRYGVKKGKFE